MYIAYLLLGYKSVQRVTVPNTVGNYNTMTVVLLNIPKHRKGTAKIWL